MSFWDHASGLVSVPGLEAFLAEHRVVLDHEAGGTQLEYVPGGRPAVRVAFDSLPIETDDVETALIYLITKAQTDERIDQALRGLFDEKAYELLMSTRLGAEPEEVLPDELHEQAEAIIEQIEVADQAMERSRLAYVEATETRNALIRQALREGRRPAKLAREIGLSREMVGRIGKREIAEQKAARAREQSD